MSTRGVPPKNVTLIAHDAFLPFSVSMVGKYDVVHVKMFVNIIKENDPAPLVRSLTSLMYKCTKLTTLPSANSVARRGERYAFSWNSIYLCRLTNGMAEPGGYLQWNDVDIDAQRPMRIPESSQSTTKSTQDMIALTSKPRTSFVFAYVGTSAFSVFLTSAF